MQKVEIKIFFFFEREKNAADLLAHPISNENTTPEKW